MFPKRQAPGSPLSQGADSPCVQPETRIILTHLRLLSEMARSMLRSVRLVSKVERKAGISRRNRLRNGYQLRHRDSTGLWERSPGIRYSKVFPSYLVAKQFSGGRDYGFVIGQPARRQSRCLAADMAVGYS